jgi:nitroreductase
MKIDKLLSTRMNDPKPFTEEELQRILTEADQPQLLTAAILCRDHAHYQRLRERLVQLGAKL